MSNFVHLNVKSEYSLLNSIAKTKDIISKVQDFDNQIVALTDINNMYNVYHFEKACQKAGVKNIIGVTFSIRIDKSLYDADTIFGNITLLATNITGYRNLVKLSTIANKGEEHTGKNGFPFIEIQELENYSSGLICLTGGTSGTMFNYYQSKNFKAIEMNLKQFIDYFGNENTFVEMQDHFIPEEKEFICSPELKRLIEKYKVDVVATNDVYYIKKEHSYHRALAVEMNPKKNGIDYYSTYVNYNDEWYLKTPEQMEKIFNAYTSIYPNIISNTLKIANMCDVSVPEEKALPEFPIPKGYDEESYLRYLAYEGFDERFNGRSDIDFDKYKERLEYELQVIKKMGFMSYHIITADFIQWAKDDKVYEHPERYFPKEYYSDYSKLPDKVYKKDYEILVGPGRGSAAGSLLCYCLKITDLDPIKDGLLFERFLNIERVSMPDIDIDFPNAYRYDVIEYVQAKYGYEKVSQIVTFQTLGLKSIIKSVGKALNIPFSRTNEMTKNVPDKELVQEEDDDGNIVHVEKKIELLSQLEKYEYFKTLINTNKDVKQLFVIGKILEGLPSSTGKHAAGVIIGRKNLMNYMPLMEVDGVMVSQFEKKACESIGMLKMDFLGLQTLDVFAECLRLIKENYGIDLKLSDINLEDKATFENIFQSGQTGKVFQFESSGMKKLLIRMKPTCLADLCAANAAYRPGPMQFIDDFIESRNNPLSVKYPTKEYETVAKATFGILFYQEQIMQIVQVMAGFTLGEADVLRRGIGKKEKKYIDEGREMFVQGCLKLKTCDEEKAKYIYSTIEKFANYGFNKSHSAAYALLAYYCGYLKAHYPSCFMAANLTINSHDVTKLAATLAETKRIGINILPPDIRFSQSRFLIEKENDVECIRFSLAAIKSIREENANIFYNVEDKSTLYKFLCEIPQECLRKNQITNLIYSGAFDYLGSRKDLCDNLNKIWDLVKTINSFKSKSVPTILSKITPKMDVNGYEFQPLEKLQKEKDCIQIALSGHPVSAIRSITKVTNTLADLQDGIIESLVEENNKEDIELACLLTNLNQIITKRGENMAFCTVEDEFFSVDGVIFPKTYEKISDVLNEVDEMPVLIKAKLQYKTFEDGEKTVSLIINDIEKVVKDTYTIYIDSRCLTDDLSSEISKFNGITNVMIVDGDNKKISKMPFSVDLCRELISVLKINNVKYVIKK